MEPITTIMGLGCNFDDLWRILGIQDTTKINQDAEKSTPRCSAKCSRDVYIILVFRGHARVVLGDPSDIPGGPALTLGGPRRFHGRSLACPGAALGALGRSQTQPLMSPGVVGPPTDDPERFPGRRWTPLAFAGALLGAPAFFRAFG